MTSWENYSEILDNKDFKVSERANYLAKGADEIKIAVGYFFIGGFELLAEDLEDIETVQILIGHETDAETIEQLKRTLTDDFEEFDPDEAREGIKKFYKLSQLEQVEVKVYTGENARFHPKLYLYQYPENSPVKSLGSAIVGSSNLSASGLTGNIELNVEKRDSSSIRYLDSWFDDLWKDAETFSPKLMKEILKESQFKDAVDEADRQRHKQEPEERNPLSEADVISPHEATKRFIIEQFPTEVDEGTLLKDISGEYDEKLPEFQQDAVRAARHPLEKYNGVILADSVGLGKSYIGAPLIQEGTTEQDQVLVIGPNRLEDMWMQEMFGEYSSNQEPEFDLRADATYISFSKLSRLSEKEIQRFRSYDYVLIDEAHKLRNRRTKRYAKLQAIGRQGKKFVCLTATPVQNSVRDVDNLIKVFADDNDFDIELVDAPSDIFREYDRLSSQSDDELTDDDRRRLGVLRDQIEKIMREVMISRDRDFVIDTYGDNITVGGRPIKVPERIPTKVTPNDPSLEDLYHDLVTAVAGALDDEDDTGLNLPYLVAERYDRDFDDEEELTLEYQSTAMLIAINLLKRLESSIAAFEASLDTLIDRERATRTIATGDFDDTRDRKHAIEYLENTLEAFQGEIEINEVIDAIEAMDENDRKQLIQDIDDDLEQLRELQERAQQVLSGDNSSGITGTKHDAKAATLKEKLQRELSGEKVLLFSQFVPTIEHLFEELTGQNPERRQVASLLGNEDTTVAFVHGDTYDDRLIDRFAPQGRSPDEAVTSDDEIDILLSTDVIGEGQNLQDARSLVNYDLHWNPMKMEQRIGRIDRITTRHDELYIYNFVPVGDLRKHLGLLERLETKIQRIAESVGHSAPIIDSAEERVQKSFTIYEDLDEADFTDAEFEGIGSKYDDLRRRIQRFCENHNISIEELRKIKAESIGVDSVQYFVNHNTDESAYMALTRLWFSTDRSEWRATLFNKSGLATVTLGDQTKFQNHPRKGSDDVSIFETIASSDDTRHNLPVDEEDGIRTFASDIDSKETWESEILSRSSQASPTIKKIEKLCQRVAEDESYGDETTQKARAIRDELSCDSVPGVEKMEMSDFAKQELEQIYRKRSRYGYKGVINRLHQKLTKDIQLAPPERVTGADTVLFGDLE
jgi:SNF2 family DNA or RNA helicase